MTTLSEQVADLAARVWAWREETSFRSADDIPRIAHDPLWLPRIDRDSMADRIAAITGFTGEWRSLDVTSEPVAVQVDCRLIGSTLARAKWDIEVLRSWQRDANFLLSQILGPYVDLLLPLPPFGERRVLGLIAALDAVPAQVALAQANLAGNGVADLAGAAVSMLEGIEQRLTASVGALRDVVPPEQHARLLSSGAAAGSALAGYHDWLVAALPTFGPPVVVGRERFLWYLRNVALIAEDPEQLTAAAEQEYRRAVVWESIGRTRRSELPPLFSSVEEQTAQQRRDEQSIRDFYEERDLLSQDGYGHYHVHPAPAYLSPLQWFAVNDDLTDVRRPGEDGLAYTPDPGLDLPYFYAANARDPRLGIIHEGTHYQQLVRSWAHENPLRRHYFDSVANEGIAFYNEEAMLQAGLFDDSAHSRSVVQNFMRLRALRVLVDVNLATGVFDLAAGADTFVRRVPMDVETATEETAMYVATPGLAMSYQVGKLQLIAMLAEAIERDGSGFSFRRFHDWVWKNGNLPFSLQRWELLGDRSEVDRIDEYESEAVAW
ncbi:MAG: DUF885 family protein [Lacisediminihabitans sp.]